MRLLEVFEGVHERDVIQVSGYSSTFYSDLFKIFFLNNQKDHLNMEYNWLMNEMLREFANVRQLCLQTKLSANILPSVINKLFWYHGLEQRIKVPMEKFSYLYPNLLQGDLGYQLRDSYKQTIDLVEKYSFFLLVLAH